MHAADIDSTARQLKPRSVKSMDVVSWDSISSIVVCRLPSLVDETGLILHTPAGELYVRETQEGYQALFSEFNLSQDLPDDWYPKVEAGESYSVQLKNSSDL